MKTPPSGFVRRLASFNKALRVRWSYERRKWVLEAKARDRRALEKPVRFTLNSAGALVEKLLPVLSDKYIGYHEGYYQIFYADKLNDAIFAELIAADMRGFKRVGDFDRAVRDQEAQAESRFERRRREQSYAHSDEVWNYMANRGSQAFPGGTSL